MTTNNLKLTSLFVAIILTLPFSILAQSTTTATSTEEGVIEQEEKKAQNTLKNNNWFSVEKLSGDNLAVGDFVVGPGRREVTVEPGKSVTVDISVANRISDNRVFELTVEDIAGSTDGAQAVELLGDEVGPNTLKDYISFPQNTFELNLGDRAKIPVTISVPHDAEPGGYYGAVLVSTVQLNEEESEMVTTRSPIIARVGTLFFVTVPGIAETKGETIELSIKDKKMWYENGPLTFNLLYENSGSVHLNPYGEIRVKNTFGEEVGFLELEPWFALPKSLRTRTITWDREILFGRYTATAFVNRGYDDVVDEKSVVFWILPWKAVGGTFLVVFVLVFCFRLFFKTFEFKRKS